MTAVQLTWQVLLSDLDAPQFHVLRSLPSQPWTQVTPELLDPISISSDVATYRYSDEGVPPGRTYRYALRDASAEITGPWLVRVANNRTFLPVVFK